MHHQQWPWPPEILRYLQGSPSPCQGIQSVRHVCPVRKACALSFELDGQTVFRYDPPTGLSPTLSHSIPSPLNPLLHVFSLARSLQALTMSVRLLPPAESPSSPSFMASEVMPKDVGDDILTSACSSLISQLGKLKEMNLSWEDKVLFLKLYREKQG